MKVFSAITAFCLFSNAAAFTVKTPRSSSTALRMSDAQLGFPGAPTGGNEPEVFSLDLPFQRFEGGDTLRTWKMPQDGERVEYVVKTNGRPMKAKIELWQGPIRKTHELTIDMQDGDKTPFRAILKYKKGPQVLKISNIGPYEFPLMAAVHVPTNERAEKLRKMTEDLFEKSPKEFVQGGPGGSTKGGAIRTFPIPNNVKSAQMIVWSKEVSGKGSKALIEVLQGPNNPKQVLDFSVAGGSQPYHCVFATPGEGVTIRFTSKQFLEFPTRIVVLPYEYEEVTTSDTLWM
uniref:Uncharacterized protein n=2 Tax=Ditylum brightwellii TaxID=49249 RepID=A0A6S8XLC5_9STRA|mmetsp:Transcript_37851/g.56669  ORF Transcript_37851/g.56669 Transcript_37851/m.56669 type:complete len:289 (+) Transcript_37851:64-930(+)|eukprot:2345328-Ditylum_brightwellii.AAC.1